MMELVPLQEAHLPQMERLEQLCFAEPWSEASLRHELEDPLSLWLVMQEDGVVLGYAGSHLVVDEADIMNVATAPAARRRGIGRSVLSRLLAELKARGAASVTLEVRESNVPALGLYQALGFQQAGRRPGYYVKPREDALILRLILGGEGI